MANAKLWNYTDTFLRCITYKSKLPLTAMFRIVDATNFLSKFGNKHFPTAVFSDSQTQLTSVIYETNHFVYADK